MELVDRLSESFARLDTSGEGALDIGVEIPSAAQTEDLISAQVRVQFQI